MQLPGEHAHCGPALDPESGFTYSPQIFMENDSEILYYILFTVSMMTLFQFKTTKTGQKSAPLTKWKM